jgi:DNA repair protein RadC
LVDKTMSLRIQDLPENDRPRERLLKLGAKSLTNAELLALFINTGTPGMNALQMGTKMLQDMGGSLRNLSRHGAMELSKRFHGLGPAKAAHIAAAFELGRRTEREEILEQPMNNPELIYRYLGGDMAQQGFETLRILVLNTKLCLVHDELIFQGTVNESPAHPREIMRAAIVNRAHGFVLAHNSGDPKPSEADIRFTQRIREIAKLMQINFMDHVIIGGRRDGALPYFSFREAGML